MFFALLIFQTSDVIHSALENLSYCEIIEIEKNAFIKCDMIVVFVCMLGCDTAVFILTAKVSHISNMAA